MGDRVPSTSSCSVSTGDPPCGDQSSRASIANRSLDDQQKEHGKAGASTLYSRDKYLSCFQPENAIRRKYLAVCTSAGGIYKKLNEIDVSKVTSDAALFLAIKELYQEGGKFRGRRPAFWKPVNVEFVQVRV